MVCMARLTHMHTYTIWKWVPSRANTYIKSPLYMCTLHKEKEQRQPCTTNTVSPHTTYTPHQYMNGNKLTASHKNSFIVRTRVCARWRVCALRSHTNSLEWHKDIVMVVVMCVLAIISFSMRIHCVSTRHGTGRMSS